MAKTKQQKRFEAQARKRAFFHVYQKAWVESQPGGRTYMSRTKSGGVEFAEQGRLQAEQNLVRAAQEAGVDRHGNLES